MKSMIEWLSYPQCQTTTTPTSSNEGWCDEKEGKEGELSHRSTVESLCFWFAPWYGSAIGVSAQYIDLQVRKVKRQQRFFNPNNGLDP